MAMSLTPAQQAYYDAIVGMPGQGTPDEILSYVRGLNDYQSLASLANVQGRSNELTSGASGYTTMDELESMYSTPITDYGSGTSRTSTLTTTNTQNTAGTEMQATSPDQLRALYQQYFGRAPDESGFNFWLNSGYSPEQIAAEFRKSPEYQSKQAQQYATGTPATADQINALYKEVFKRDADPEGLKFYQSSRWSPEQIKAQLLKSPEYKSLSSSTGNTGNTGGTTNPYGGGAKTSYLGTDIDPSQSTLSPNFADYVYKMLARGEEAATQPYQEYIGQRFAGPSDIQQQAFKTAQGLTTPSQYGEASTAANKALQGLGQLAYTPTQFQDKYQAPQAYTAGQFGNQFTAPETYKPTDIATQQWSAQAAQQYMNPFLQQALDPQLRELTRQSDVARQADAARLAQAGAFGGSRQAIMESEGRRSLLDRQSDVLSQGYKTAFDVGQQAFMTDQQRALAAQQAAEQSKQFGAQQGMTAAQTSAQYGLAGLQAQEASRQFAAQQAARSAEQAAQYGLDTQRAQETANQFGANYGLQGLQSQLQGAQTLAGIGTAQGQMGLQNLQQQAALGATQQQLAQQPLDFGYQQWQESMKYPYQQATYMQSLLQGLPLQAAPYSDGTSGWASALQGGLLGLMLANQGKTN